MSMYFHKVQNQFGVLRFGNTARSNEPASEQSFTDVQRNKSSSDEVQPEQLNEIVDRVRQMERLVAEALVEEPDKYVNVLKQRNSELEGILNLVKSQLCDNTNQLLLLLEEERALREDIQAELEAVKARWKVECENVSDSAIKSDDKPEESQLERKVCELEAECEMLRTLIRNERTSP